MRNRLYIYICFGAEARFISRTNDLRPDFCTVRGVVATLLLSIENL